jgi:hypothetical protein
MAAATASLSSDCAEPELAFGAGVLVCAVSVFTDSAFAGFASVAAGLFSLVHLA